MFHWDPDPVFWTVPLINLPIAWYGILFAVGFFIGYLLMCRLVERALGDRALAVKYTDKLLVMCVIGTLIGARLGHVFFYDWPIYRENLWAILNIRAGGLASHGAAVGVFVSLIAFQLMARKQFKISFWRLLDMVVIPTIFIGTFIRLGNFVNQEVVGTETNVPWAVIFGHPMGGEAAIPRHPAQLYEALVYLMTFAGLWTLYRFVHRREGVCAGLFFILVFGSRIIIEFFKAHQSAAISNEALFSMGQLLSFPLVVGGMILFIWGLRHVRDDERLPHS